MESKINTSATKMKRFVKKTIITAFRKIVKAEK